MFDDDDGQTAQDAIESAQSAACSSEASDAIQSGDAAGVAAAVGSSAGDSLEQAGSMVGGETGETMSAVGNATSTASDTAGAAASGSEQLLGGGSSPEDIAADVLGYTGTAAGIASGVGSAAANVADMAGASQSVLSAIGTARSVAGTVQSVAGSALNIYNTIRGIVQLGPRVEYSLCTSNTIEEILDTSEWVCHSVALDEALSETPEAVLTIELPNPDVDPTVLVGANAELRMEREPRQRHFKGVVRRVLHGATDDRTTRIRIHVVPAFHLMEQRINTRIFQDKTVKEILETVLTEGLQPFGRKFDLDALSDNYPKREYCVQYRESDYDFCSRLMQEEGISYHFVHDFIPDPSADECQQCGQNHRPQHPCEEEFEVLTLADSNEHYFRVDELDPLPTPIVARGSSGIEGISDLQRRVDIVPTSIAVDGRWDFTSCSQPAAEKRSRDAHGREREYFDHDVELTFSDYGETQYEAHDAERQADIRRKLQSLQEEVCIGLGFVVRMKPGMIFEVTEHPKPELNGIYLLTRVHHVSRAPDVDGAAPQANYHNRFECVPIRVPVVPQRTHRKPRIPGAITAIVCGPSDSESEDQHAAGSDRAPMAEHRVHADEHGRVKLWFPWDRYGRRTDLSTCWVRVQQPWAGDGWGSMFIPHVGMEAVVNFIEGDPDRPIVTGTVYNGNNRPPLDVKNADNKKSTFRTVSGNELRFDDTAGAEEIYLHAQYDYNGVVENNRTDHVKVDDTETIDGHQVCTVGKDRTRNVHGEEKTTVDKNRTLTVKGGLHHVDVTGEHRVTASEKVYIDAGTEIILKVGESQVTINGQSITIQAGNGASITLDANVLAQSNAGAQLALDENAQMQEQSGQSHVLCQGDTAQIDSASGGSISVNSAITSNVGSSTVEVVEGSISVAAATVGLDGSGSTCMLEAGKASLASVETEVVGGEGASSIKADPSAVSITAPQINLN